MVDWWFDWHPRDPVRYRVWHPLAHESNSVELPAVPGEKPHWGTVHHPVEDIGTGTVHARIAFHRPEVLGFSAGALDRPEVATILCGLAGDDRRRMQHTKMVHVFLHEGDGVVLRSCFWLGAAIRPYAPEPLAGLGERALNRPARQAADGPALGHARAGAPLRGGVLESGGPASRAAHALRQGGRVNDGKTRAAGPVRVQPARRRARRSGPHRSAGGGAGVRLPVDGGARRRARPAGTAVADGAARADPRSARGARVRGRTHRADASRHGHRDPSPAQPAGPRKAAREPRPGHGRPASVRHGRRLSGA